MPRGCLGTRRWKVTSFVAEAESLLGATHVEGPHKAVGNRNCYHGLGGAETLPEADVLNNSLESISFIGNAENIELPHSMASARCLRYSYESWDRQRYSCNCHLGCLA